MGHFFLALNNHECTSSLCLFPTEGLFGCFQVLAIVYTINTHGQAFVCTYILAPLGKY